MNRNRVKQAGYAAQSAFSASTVGTEGGGVPSLARLLAEKPGRRITIGRAVEAHAEDLRSRNYSPDTIRFLRNLLSAFYRTSGMRPESALIDVTGAIAERVMRRFAATYAPGTAWGYGVKLARLFRAFAASGLVLENPFGHVAWPRKPPRSLLPILTREEVARLLATPNLRVPSGIRNRAILEIFYSTAIRLSECAGLELGDVDFAKGTLRVRGKGAKERVVPVGAEAIRWLRRYLESVRPRFAKESGALWVGQEGKPVKPLWIQVTIRRLGRKIGKTVTPHTLRRTCASQLLAGGASAWVVKELLGHADGTSLAHYLRVHPHELKDVHEKTHPRS